MNRFIIRTGLALILILASLSKGCQSPGNSSDERPNILFIFTDQQHAGMLGISGNPHVSTPNLDRLAEKGIRFEEAYSTNPVCIPSRFSMMTGTLPSVIGMEANEDQMNPVPEEILTHAMGNLFKKAGYSTVYGGKIHLPGPGEIIEDVRPFGFDEYLTSDDRDLLAKESAEFIRREHDRPFILVNSFINPHDICYMAINDFMKKVNGREEPIGGTAWEELSEALLIPPGISESDFFDTVCPPLPDNFIVPGGELSSFMAEKPEFMRYVREHWSEEEWRLHRWAYARLTERVDGQIGIVLDALKESGQDKNTLVIFTSDHGDQDAAHRVEHKAFLYQESVRVPLLICWEGQIEPAKVDRTHLVMTGLDILPTMCDFAGIPIPEELRGKSLRPVAEGKTVDEWRDYIISENHMGRMVYDGRWKYVAGRSEKHRDEECPHCERYTTDYEPLVLEMLMDLQDDPGETVNLAGDPGYREQLEKGRKRLKEWYAENGFELDSLYLY